MENSSESINASPPSTAVTLHSFIDSVRDWLESFFALVVLEGKKAGSGLALILGFGVGAVVLTFTGWLVLVGCFVAALVENDILGWIWSLLLVAMLNFAGAGGLVFLAIKHKQDLMFSATRRQLGLKSVPPPKHE